MTIFKRNAAPVNATDRFRPVFITAAVSIVFAAVIILSQDIGVLNLKNTQLGLEKTRLATLQHSVDKKRKAVQLAKKSIESVSAAEPAINVLGRIEAAWSDDISLLRMETDVTKGRMQMHINATSREAIFSFVDRLKQQFGNDVFLQRHTKNGSEDDAWLLDASLVLGWK